MGDVMRVSYLIIAALPSGSTTRARTLSPPLAMGTLMPREWSRDTLSMSRSTSTEGYASSAEPCPAPAGVASLWTKTEEPLRWVTRRVSSGWNTSRSPSWCSTTTRPSS